MMLKVKAKLTPAFRGRLFCYAGWIVAAFMGLIAGMCELGRELAVEQAGLLRANLGSFKARLDSADAALERCRQGIPEPPAVWQP